MSNLDLWERLGKTDPSHTKQFKRGGGFSGTAIKPMWSYKRMTEEFGPCGTGWGVCEPSFQVVPGPEGEVLVFCTASIWYGPEKNLVFGVGGDKAVGKNKYGLQADDEAFKKAFTDAITNALKLIGVGADVHMGMFDDSKYVSSMREEFGGDDGRTRDRRSEQGRRQVDDDKRPANSAEQKRQLDVIEQELLDARTDQDIQKLVDAWGHIAERDGWSREYWDEARRRFKRRKDEIAAQGPSDFPGDPNYADSALTKLRMAG